MDKYCYRKEDGKKLLYFNASIDETPEWYTKYFHRDVEEHRNKKAGTPYSITGNYYVFSNVNLRTVSIMDKYKFDKDYSLEPIKSETNAKS
jgi:hypothetical protein